MTQMIQMNSENYRYQTGKMANKQL